MKEVEMDIQWRTIQFFIEEAGIFEVEMDYENSKKVRCNCPDFQLSARCKHQKWVKARIAENEGQFSLEVPDDLDDDLLDEVLSTAEGFRQFVLRHGEIEVI